VDFMKRQAEAETIIFPAIPDYGDDEVAVFHPALGAVLGEALRRLGQERHLKVVHHYPTASGPVDFAVVRRSDGKVVLPVEVKRTKTAVRTQGRRQARDYRANLGANCGDYYLATNLELVELFKASPMRSTTLSQKIALPEEGSAGSLAEARQDPGAFWHRLADLLAEALDLVLTEGGVYAQGFAALQERLKAAGTDDWHRLLMPSLFEYIRGTAESIPALKTAVGRLNWMAAGHYRSNPAVLARMGSQLDFAAVFAEPHPRPRDPESFDPAVLGEAFKAGAGLNLGEDVAELVYEILAPEAKGIVETDLELARLLAVVARDALPGGVVPPGRLAWDPGAGTGRLLASLGTVFPDLEPGQVWGSDLEARFAEPMALRLGLAWNARLAPGNAPRVTVGDLAEADFAETRRVGLVVMNPPYLSGIESIRPRRTLAAAIRRITGRPPLLNTGQAPLESVFLEMVWNLVPEGTVIAAVFPAQHLVRRGAEAQELRAFLAQDLALTHIVQYPMEGIFGDVIKQTVLLAGRKGQAPEKVKIARIETPVAETSPAALASALAGRGGLPGITVETVARDRLYAARAVGWRGFAGTGRRAGDFIAARFAGFSTLADLAPEGLRRGTLGNSGSTPLEAPVPDDADMAPILARIPHDWLKRAIVNSDDLPRVLGRETLKRLALCPSEDAFVPGTPARGRLLDIARAYRPLLVAAADRGRQRKDVKSPEAIIGDLRKDVKEFPGPWVLIPRAARKAGTVALVEEEGVIVSTNFVMAGLGSVRGNRLLASWILSVFGQLQLENACANQEGMRKLEVGTVRELRYPDFSALPEETAALLAERVLAEEPLSFEDPALRPLDYLWAEALDPDNGPRLAAEAMELARGLIMERRGMGN
jgi:hypothetical protein